MKSLFSKKSDYGVQLLTALAGSKKNVFVSLKQVARKNKLPYKFVGQIAQELKKANILESKEGVRGGYRLSRPAEYISLAEVIEALDGKVEEECGKGEACGCGHFCIRDDVHEPAAAAAMGAMNERTIADLC